MNKLSTRQQQALDILKQHISDNGYAPTVRELAEMIGHKSSSTTHNVLKKLQEKGYIKNVGVRAIEILSPYDELQSESEMIANEIATLISTYDYPLEVLQDVHKRLADCADSNYARQQARYLQNIAEAGLVAKK